MKYLLFDSDVILDIYLKREPHSVDSCKALKLCEQHGIKLYSTPVILSNIHHMLKKTYGKEKANISIAMILKLFKVIEMNQQSFDLIMLKKFLDFEDALQYTAAEQYGEIEAIITRNTKDFKASKLPILTPTEFLASMKSAT